MITLIVTVVALLIIGAVLLELTYRIYKWKTSFRTIYRKSNTPGLLFELRPNYKKIYKGEDYEKKILYSTNKFGQRNPDFNIKEKGLKKILIIGDSIAFGFGVDEQHTFPRVLEKILNKKKYQFRVINASVGTYNVIQDYYFIKHRAKYFKPEQIILCLNLSNLVSSSDWTYDEKKKYVTPKFPSAIRFKSNTKGPFGGKFSKVGKLLDKLYLYRFVIKPILYKKTFKVKNYKLGNIDAVIKYEQIFKKYKNIQSRLNYLTKIKKETSKLNCKLKVIIFPQTAQLENQFEDIFLPQTAIKNYCRKNKIEVKDVAAYFKNIAKPAKYLYFDEVHLTTDGHRLVADYLANLFKIN